MRSIIYYQTLCEIVVVGFCIFLCSAKGSKYYPKIFKRRHKKPCDEETLIRLLAEIQVINPETIINLSTLEKVKPLCKKVSENLEKIEELLSDCEPPNQPDLYLQLVKGVEILYRKLCTDSPFRKEFEEHFSCLHKFRKEFDKCNGAPDWMENSDSEVICTEYKKISDCYYEVAGSHCGREAAEVMKELVVSIVNSILTVKCDINDIGGNPEDELELAAGPDRTPPKKTKPINKLKGKTGRTSSSDGRKLISHTIVFLFCSIFFTYSHFNLYMYRYLLLI